jgi:hypothetical protein
MLVQASQDSQLGEMLAIVLMNNSALDANSLDFANLELIRAPDVRALKQKKTASESLCNQSQRRLDMVKSSIVKIRKSLGPLRNLRMPSALSPSRTLCPTRPSSS